MSKKLRTRFLVAVGILMLTAGSALAQSDATFEFPDVEGWEKSDIIDYGQPGFGYSINYDSDGGSRVSVYVYDSRLPNIESGIKSKTVRDELGNAEMGIAYLGQRGDYQNVKKKGSDTFKLGGDEGKVEALRSSFTFRSNDADRVSHIYLFGYKKNFIKFRVTRLAHADEDDDVAFSKILAAMDDLFAE